MAMKIRLARGGSKKRPFYRIVAADRLLSAESKLDMAAAKMAANNTPFTPAGSFMDRHSGVTDGQDDQESTPPIAERFSRPA